MSNSSNRLSKSRFMAGLQCHRQLWWKVHDRDAAERAVDPAQQALFDQGTAVGELARLYVLGGVLIDLPHDAMEAKVAATRAAIDAGARVIYEASFQAQGVFVAVDILEKIRGGWRVIEVKGTTKVKEQHLPDLAVQVYVVREAGLKVRSAQLMHLNRECRFPELDALFTRTELLAEVEETLADIPAEIAAQQKLLSGSLPEVEVGAHCSSPYPCPFAERCHPAQLDHHVSTLYRISDKKLLELTEAGCEHIDDVPAEFELSPIQERQCAAVRTGELILERGLRKAVGGLKGRTGYLDFETVSLAVPVWDGCRPYETVPVQFSCHAVGEDGSLQHFEWLAEGSGDPREPFAEALLKATAGLDVVVAYNMDFEKGCIEGLAVSIPELAGRLRRLSRRFADLLPIIRENVYHPAFRGSFGLKSVLPALLPALDYADLEIGEGSVASAELARLMFRREGMTAVEEKDLRNALLKYCHRDTWGMVKMLELLRSAASQGRSTSSTR